MDLIKMHFIYVRNARRVTTKCIKTVKDDVDLFSKVPPMTELMASCLKKIVGKRSRK